MDLWVAMGARTTKGSDSEDDLTVCPGRAIAQGEDRASSPQSQN